MGKPKAEIFKGNSKFANIGNYVLGKYDLRLNRVSCAIEVKPKGQTEWHELNDADLEIELFSEGFTGFKDMLSALIKSSYVQQYDPIVEYFSTLEKWDEKTDYISQLAGFITVTDQQFWLNMYRKMLVRTVAQALNRIAFNKHCLTLFGGQHSGKTSYLEYHVPPAMKAYTKKGVSFDKKDSQRDLASNFIINFDELDKMERNDLSRVKSYFSEESVKLRLPYDRNDTIMKRRASFVGTTNLRDILTDETGNVRWLIFEVKKVNHDQGGMKGYQQIDINKVWAQAYFLLNNGFSPHLTNEDIAHSEKNNSIFSKESTEYQLVIKYFEECSEADGGLFYTSTDVLERLIILTEGRFRLSSGYVGRAIVKMNITKSLHNRGGSKHDVWGYWLRELPGHNLRDLEPLRDNYLNSLNGSIGKMNPFDNKV